MCTGKYFYQLNKPINLKWKLFDQTQSLQNDSKTIKIPVVEKIKRFDQGTNRQESVRNSAIS